MGIGSRIEGLGTPVYTVRVLAVESPKTEPHYVDPALIIDLGFIGFRV